jgi:hypothetical protein
LQAGADKKAALSGEDAPPDENSSEDMSETPSVNSDTTQD